MNLLVKKFGPLAIILLAALTAISCEDPGSIGLVINADNGTISSHFVNITLPTAMVQFNPRKTSDARSIQAGQWFTPEFGLVTSKSYSQLKLPLIIVPNDSAIYKSFEMAVAFTSFVGEELLNNETQKIDIYQLAEDIDTTATYTRLDELGLMPNPMGSWEFEPRRSDTLYSDTTFIFPLDDAIGLDLFEKLKGGDPIFDSDAAFNQVFKGIALVPTNNNKDIFQLDADKVKLILNYDEFNSDGVAINRSFDIAIGSSGFYHLNSDKSGTAFSSISPDNTDFFPSDNYRYLQYGTLMAIRADLTPIYELMDTLEFMIINKAELRLGDVRQYGEALKPPSFVQTYFTDETNKWPIVDTIGRLPSSKVGTEFIMLQEEGGILPPAGAYGTPAISFYNAGNLSYSINMSLFLQNLYAGNFSSVSQPFLEEKGMIYIMGETDVLFPQKTSSHVLSSPMAVNADSIRFRIHYTIPTEQNK